MHQANLLVFPLEVFYFHVRNQLTCECCLSQVMADNLPADLVVLYQDAFAHFDTDNDGIITTKSLGPLLRYCGENPSEAEVQVTTFSITQNTRQIHHLVHTLG